MVEQLEVLDHGYVRFIDSFGSDQAIIEAARMSTDKGFIGWEKIVKCRVCDSHWQQWDDDSWSLIGEDRGCVYCDNHPSFLVNTDKVHPGDAKLLRYLYEHKHMTPFEMAGLVIEVKAPIFVFREWHRHRTQSYNEMSARYVPLPDQNYVPSRERCVVIADEKNRQATGNGAVATDHEIESWLCELQLAYSEAQRVYAKGIEIGIPKELARLPVPVARYSRMRASANLRNWLGFLTLRLDKNAQKEIREYAWAVANIIKARFPRTYELFGEGL